MKLNWFPAEKSDSASSSAASKSETSGAGGKSGDDVYEFKTGAALKDAPSRTGSPSGNAADQPAPAEKSGKDAQPSSGKDDKKASVQQQQPQAGDKRGHDNEDDEEARSSILVFTRSLLLLV